MKNYHLYTVLSLLLLFIIKCDIMNMTLLARTVNIKEVEFRDKKLIREIVSNMKSDSIRNEIKKYFFPNAKFDDIKYRSIGLCEYPMCTCWTPEVIDLLLPKNANIDSCQLLVTITYSSNLSSDTFTTFYGDTIFVETFPLNVKMNAIYTRPTGNQISVDNKIDLKNLSNIIITQFLYINGRLYLNPNKSDWLSAYE